MSSWTLTYQEWSPQRQPLREAICTLGNGFFATRGAAEEASAGGEHYPGTYLAGGYNRLESEVAGRIIENEDLVNWPNWLCLSFRIEGGDWFHISTVDVLDYQQSLHLREGILERRVRFRHAGERETTVISRRFVHMGNPHLAGIEWTLEAENWSGQIEIRSALDGTVLNHGVARYRQLNSQHLHALYTDRLGEDGICLAAETTQSRLRMVQVARTQVFCDAEPVALERQTLQEQGLIEQRLLVHCERHRPLRVEKIVALYTSRDFAISEPYVAARNELGRAGGFQELLESHAIAWSHLWHRGDIEIDQIDGDWHQLVLRLHIFHLLQTTSFHSIDLDTGVTARGLHGEAYRGHIFWDELFIFPFLNLRIPELTRSLLLYRHRRLPEARHLARQAGYCGAMFPWQSGSDGREESQVVHLNPRSGRWIPDDSHRQRHVNAAIAYNAWQYYQATDDIEFLSFHGAEMILEIARFWASIASFNPQRDRYEICGVVGPDEFHTHLPGSDQPGLNNNAYTNVMAAWVLCRARDVLDELGAERRQELLQTLKITDAEIRAWQEISRKMFVPFHDGRIISQFEGYERLQEFDWHGYRQEHGDVQRLDRILESEGDDVNRYKAGKQADVLMLFYVFSAEELAEIFASMGYAFDPQSIPDNVQYYMNRTSHGSTLSFVTHSWVLARADRTGSWKFFGQALEADVSDIQGGTTAEGVHLGAMAGTVDLLQRGYTGIELRDGVLWLNPHLPDALDHIRMRIRYRAHTMVIHLAKSAAKITITDGGDRAAKIGFCGEVHEITQGETLEFSLDPRNPENC